ncbi:EscE/YscE/SsaE family type III secretion system needle protein co-chaperone [Shewanella sp. SR44-3]|uniref:EscE/YscE/SsaE family type III secretion system needle protein co-chaperone n=1 Tax=unclassified Shewanella TaxID=196818 RepID=UPI0015FD30C8|nr:EscE/YscE/SsaE family type III secretion system needle protein co-chaperone [Shewanella sp. SR44-3]MBB1269002.1 EscE/YscE/SsaE family type III secretion system needle protein co-chaperone [Shewanella sp. SR44-3]
MTESPVNMTQLEARLRGTDGQKERANIQQLLDSERGNIKREINAGCRPEHYLILTKQLTALEAAQAIIGKL